MNIDLNAIDLIVLSLAVWRLSSLFAAEEGPWEIFEKIRQFSGVKYKEVPPYEMYGTNVVSRGLICVWCNSIWIGLLATILYAISTDTIYLFIPFSLSGVAILLDRLLETEPKL